MGLSEQAVHNVACSFSGFAVSGGTIGSVPLCHKCTLRDLARLIREVLIDADLKHKK